jgi:hypothetical protein
MPLGVAQEVKVAANWKCEEVSRGFMPLGVAQRLIFIIYGFFLQVSRGFMPLGVAQSCKMKRLMLLATRSHEQPLQMAEFDKQAALEALCQGQTVIPFWCDRVHQQLRDNLKSFSS